jgi:hypothetical protein
MTLRLAQFRCAAAAISAAGAVVAVVALTAPSARAFTMETLSTGGNSTRFADPDERNKNFGQGQGSQPFGPGGPAVQFGAGQGAGQGSYPRPFGGPHGGFYGPPPPLVGGN